MIKKHVLHKRSKEIGKVPSETDIEYGEIAINYLKDNETISIKNSSDEIITLPLKGGGGSGGDIDILAIGFMTTLNDNYTGLADYYGLRKIGWTYEDIFYYQKHGVNWNREDDELHKVPQNNIELYGVINASNIQTYSNILVYLPKIDTSKWTDFSNMFSYCPSLTSIPVLDTSQGTDFYQMFRTCESLTSIPLLDTSNGTNFSGMFYYCKALTTIPLLDTSNGTNFNGMFWGCESLTSIPLLDTSNGTNFSGMFYYCKALTTIPLLDTSQCTNFSDMFDNCLSLTTIPLLDTSQCTNFSDMFYSCKSLTTIPLLNTSNGTNFSGMFSYCTSLTTIPLLNTSNGTNFNGMFYNCYILSDINLKGLPLSIDLSPINKVTINKESILFIINNSTATSANAVTVKLDTNNYSIYSAGTDADVTAALIAKPFVTLIQ